VERGHQSVKSLGNDIDVNYNSADNNCGAEQVTRVVSVNVCCICRMSKSSEHLWTYRLTVAS